MTEGKSEARARLRLVEFDLFSLVRTGFLISLSAAATIVVSAIVIYLLLLGMGVFSSVDALLGEITGGAGKLTDTVTLPFVITSSIAAGVFEILVTTALVGIFGFIYNLTVPFTRGLEVTLAEDRD